MLSKYFDFFGIVVEAEVMEVDAEHLDFFYGEFKTNSTQAQYHVTLECLDWPARGFFESLLAKDDLLKRVLVKERYGPDFENEFRTWSNLPSPLPPFHGKHFQDNLLTYPGTVLRLPNGIVLGLIGENYVGKTSLAIALANLGAELISDSLIIVDSNSGEALKYETPIGFRRTSLLNMISRADQSDFRVTVSPDTGLVLLMKPIDVLGKHNAEGGAINQLVILRKTVKNDTFSIKKIKTPNIPWFGSSDCKVAPSYSELVEFNMTPILLAERILVDLLRRN